jgi:hypothetical protein
MHGWRGGGGGRQMGIFFWVKILLTAPLMVLLYNLFKGTLGLLGPMADEYIMLRQQHVHVGHLIHKLCHQLPFS